jgi:two-component system, chemotaxis family, CheB/CheR fusion protein
MKSVPSQLKILLVENHQDTLAVLVRYLEQRGHKVWSATDMESALELLRENSMDVLISDIALPSGSGWELMRQIRTFMEPPFSIAMSGYSIASDRKKSIDAGFQHHLVKPFLPDELDTILDRLC